MLLLQSKVEDLCANYKSLSAQCKNDFLWTLALKYAVDHKYICGLAKKLAQTEVLIFRVKQFKLMDNKNPYNFSALININY